MKKNFKRPEKSGASERSNQTVVYGVMPVLELLRSKPARIDRLLIAKGAARHRLKEIFDLARKADIRVDTVEHNQLRRLVAEGANDQGVLAISAAANYVDADTIVETLSGDTLVLLLDGVEDPRNLGAILRTAECAGVDGIFIPDRRAVGLTETVAKSSAGAVEHVKIAKVGNLNNLITQIKERNVWVVGTSVDAKMTYAEWDWTRPTALVIGGEGRGLHRLVAENCDVLVNIPMYGRIDSLNVSVAAGVILFEARRQRDEKAIG